MLWLNCLRFSMSRCFCPPRFFGLGISMSEYMCFHGLVFIFIVKAKNHAKFFQLKNISIIQIYATAICIMLAYVSQNKKENSIVSLHCIMTTFKVIKKISTIIYRQIPYQMYDTAENNAKKNFTEVSLTVFISLKTVLVSKLCRKILFNKCLLFH